MCWANELQSRLSRTHSSDLCRAPHTFNSFLFTSFPVYCVFPQTQTQTCGTNVWIYLSDKPWLLPLSFSLCCCCYHNHSAAWSFKCEGLDVLFHPFACGAEELFSPYLVWPFCFFFPVSENACGLKLFKCSLLRTSCLITYLLDLLSHIFSLKDKLKEKCWLSSSQRRLRDLKELKKTLVLINNSHVIACILVKSLEDTEVLMALTFLKALDSMVWKRIPQSTGRNENALR